MSNKKIIIYDNLTIIDIISRIENESIGHENIFLEIWNNHVLRNYLNLKLLIYKFPKKKFNIVSGSQDLKKMCESLWISHFHKTDLEESWEEILDVNILKHNYTFFEYLIYEIKRVYFLWINFLRKRNIIYKSNHLKENSNVFLLIFSLIISLTLLLFIFYFAVPKTYIYITPKLYNRPVVWNLFFSEKEEQSIENKSLIKVKKISHSTNMTYSFNISQIDQASAKNANWTITIINWLNQEQPFKPKTRFATEDWLVFRSTEWAKIPPNWQAMVKVVADIYDSNSKIIWDRGNLKIWTLLTIPGLKFNRDKVYAKVNADFTWWENPKNHVLTKDELEKFKWIFVEKIKNKALEELKNKIKEENIKSWINFQIIPINDNIKYSTWAINLLNWVKIGDIRDDVTLEWSVSINSYLYDKNGVSFFLKNVSNEKLSETEKFLSLNDDSVRITNIFSKIDTPFYMKATVEMDSTISYDFENSLTNLTKKLKNLIVNTKPEEAKSILLNSEEISSVNIKFSPFWLNKVSSNPDNIEFMIKK